MWSVLSFKKPVHIITTTTARIRRGPRHRVRPIGLTSPHQGRYSGGSHIVASMVSPKTEEACILGV